MRWLRKSILASAVATGLLAAAAWVASYFWWPQVVFPWPTSGLRQTHDAGILLLIEGRIVIVRQRVGEVFYNVEGTPDIPSANPRQLPPRDASIPPRQGSYAVDSRKLSHMTLWYLDRSGFVTHGARDPRTHYVGGIPAFSSTLSGKPTIVIGDLVVQGTWSATTVPLWPLLLAAAPGAIYLLRNRRSVRRAREGRCRSCGYDLRESPKRCPECGRPIDATVEPKAPA